MRFFKILFVSIFTTAIVLLIVLFFLPDDYKLERSISITAPPAIVYEFMSEPERIQQWLKLREFLPSDFNQAGELEISENNENQVSYIIKHDNRHGTESEFRLNKKAGQTELVWTLSGKFDFFYKWLGFFKERIFSEQMSNSLARLKSLAEKEADIDITIQESFRPVTKILAVRDTLLNSNSNAISGTLGMALTELFEFISLKNLQLTGPPMAIFINRDDEFIFDAAVPVIAPGNIRPTGRIRISKIPDGKVVEALYIGPYEKIKYAYNYIDSYLEENELEINGYIREEYLNDPVITPPQELKTNIVVPVK